MDVTPGLRREGPPDLDAVGQDEELAARIHAEIATSGPMTFARFMELALYDPAGGYYRAAVARPGREGDFLTAPETHPVFGAALARGIVEVWDRLERPDPFVLREYGAGDGTLVLSLLAGLEQDGSPLAGRIRYDPIEREQRRIATIASRLAEVGRSAALVDRAESGRRIQGVVFANELLDALPTHRVVQRGSGLRERLVGSRDGRFVDVEADPATPALAKRLVSEGIALVEGQQAEVCLAIEPWIDHAARGLERGVMILIDYGYPAVELYDPVRRPEGTLRAYVRQRVHADPYRHIGRQDLTAHVDVTAVERAAQVAGLAHLGTTTQAEFLVGLGAQDVLRRIQSDPLTSMDEYLALRSAMMRLLDPAAMGRFRVMGFSRSWPADATLAGFAYRLAAPATAPPATAGD